MMQQSAGLPVAGYDTLGIAKKGITADIRSETTVSEVYVAPSMAKYLQCAVKAWVNFNGTGTVAIRDSYNVSSITDNGTGDYTVNFTVGFLNANYAMAGSAGVSTNARFVGFITTAPTVSAARFGVYWPGDGSLRDESYVTAAFFGRL